MALSERDRLWLRYSIGDAAIGDRLADMIDEAELIDADELADEAVSSAKLAIGDLELQGAYIGYKDNATSMRVKGPQHPDEGGADVQSYSGIFYNAAYAGTGTLKTRVIHGANLEMDMEIQSPHQLRLVAVDDTQVDGQVYAASKTNMVINLRADAEVASPKQLIFDRMSDAATGSANTSDINIKASSGSLFLNSGVSDGAVVVPVLTEAQRDALSPVAGMVIFNSTSSKHQGHDGSSWNDLY